MKKALFPVLVLVLALAFGLALPMASPAAAHTEDKPYEATLYAGQNIEVGTVKVWNDGTTLYIEYETEGDWKLTETHLHIATGKSDIPQTKTSNPIPGKFMAGDYYDPPVTEDAFEFGLSDMGWGKDVKLYIAAHAVVVKTECEVIQEAPYYPSSVKDYSQGRTKGGSSVRPGRSDPEAVLTYDTGQDETNFFSLGFGGWIIVEFDCCIRNAEGSDIRVVEDTWGTYPVEAAQVYASQDGIDWALLGVADNTVRDTVYKIHTVSEFDLGNLDCAKYIKVVDTTNPALHDSSADGFDLNTIMALQDCVECATTYKETAWAEGTRFTTRGNWATYITYEVQ